MNLPNDLAGYQQVKSGYAKLNDLVIPLPGKYPEGQPFLLDDELDVAFINTTGGWDTRMSNPAFPDYRVYRKMDCPKQTGERDQIQERIDQEYHEFPPGTMGMDANPLRYNAKAETYDDGKPPLAWLPWDGIKAVSRVQAYGHAKYKDFNNFRKGMEVSRNLSCAVRHIAAFMEGETNDPESKQSHLAHAACRLLFVLQNQHDGVAIDDRYKRE